MASKTAISRREFVKDAGGILIGFSLANSGITPKIFAAVSPDSVASPLPNRVDSWLRISEDGIVHVFSGKTEVGLGVKTGYMQIIAEELDVPMERVDLTLGDTALTANQGGVGGSTSIAQGAKPLRNAAASARYVLTQMASRKLGVPPDQLEVRDGVFHVKGQTDVTAANSVSYGTLVSGGDINSALKVSGEAFNMNAEGVGKPKDPATYTIVGTSVPRVDVAPKVLGHFKYVTDIRVPGMLHGRVVRPSSVGSALVSLDDSAARKIPGYLQTVVKGNFVGVVAKHEWAAIQASRALQITWSEPKQLLPGSGNLYAYMRSAPIKSTRDVMKEGDVSGALATAAKKLEATYEFPFQSHATMGPGCGIADVHTDGITTVWSGTQKPHDMQQGIAELLHVPTDAVRVIWAEDAGSYGRPGFEDAAGDAALLSQTVGYPVRVQWMRNDMTAWGTKGPAVITELAAALDARNETRAIQITTRAFSGGDNVFRPNAAGNFLGAQLSGIPNTSGVDEHARYGNQTTHYAIANTLAVGHVVPQFYDHGSPLRTTHMRDPFGPQTAFAVESFIDEIAAAVGMDPLEYRIKYIDDARAKAILQAAAKQANWETRPSPKKISGSGNIVSGRGVGLCIRAGTYVGTIAEVEVNRKTGDVRVTRIVCAHDCGLIVNPNALKVTIEGNLIQSLSRGLFEEVKFDRNNVTSVDWISYPVARAADIPKVEIVLVNNPKIASSGAGEPSSRSTPGAIGNAIFDATGARVRQAPMTPARVKAALDALHHT